MKWLICLFRGHDWKFTKGQHGWYWLPYRDCRRCRNFQVMSYHGWETRYGVGKHQPRSEE